MDAARALVAPIKPHRAYGCVAAIHSQGHRVGQVAEQNLDAGRIETHSPDLAVIAVCPVKVAVF